jgi:hypothetical protein
MFSLVGFYKYTLFFNSSKLPFGTYVGPLVAAIISKQRVYSEVVLHGEPPLTYCVALAIVHNRLIVMLSLNTTVVVFLVIDLQDVRSQIMLILMIGLRTN